MMNPGSIRIELRLGAHSRTDSHGHNAAWLLKTISSFSIKPWLNEWGALKHEISFHYVCSRFPYQSRGLYKGAHV